MFDSRSSARSATLVSKKMRMHKTVFITVVVLLSGCARLSTSCAGASRSDVKRYEGDL